MNLFCKYWKSISVVALAALLSGCLGGDGATPTATTLGGTAATGAPIVGGTVTVKCAGGSTLTDVTDNAGVWQVTLSGQTLPCAVEVSGGDLPVGQAYHSIALQLGTLNITPLTDLIVANLAGQTPGIWFSGLNANAFQQVNANALNLALANLRTALNLAALNSIDPITTAFTAAPGNNMDDVLEALNAAFASYADLLNSATGNDFAAFAGQYQTQLADAFAARNSNGGGGGSATCTGSQVALTYAQSLAGGPHSDGEQVCFDVSTTALGFSGKTLSNPVQNGAVQQPYSAYAFSDTAAKYEVVFNASALHEINVMSADGNSFYGQFAPSSSQSGSANLTISVNAAGVASPNIVVGSVPVPANEFQFCNDVWSDPNFTGLGSAGTLTINSCSFANNVGTISATVAMTSPVSMSLPYTVTYTYN